MGLSEVSPRSVDLVESESATTFSRSFMTHRVAWPHLGGAAYQEEALVRVAIRVHKQQDLLVRSLIWALRAQQTAKTKVDFVLIPTEPQSVVFFQNLAHGEHRAQFF